MHDFGCLVPLACIRPRCRARCSGPHGASYRFVGVPNLQGNSSGIACDSRSFGMPVALTTKVSSHESVVSCTWRRIIREVLDREPNRTTNFPSRCQDPRAPKTCQACKPGDTQVLNVTRRPAVSNGSVLARREAVVILALLFNLSCSSPP